MPPNVPTYAAAFGALARGLAALALAGLAVAALAWACAWARRRGRAMRAADAGWARLRAARARAGGLR